MREEKGGWSEVEERVGKEEEGETGKEERKEQERHWMQEDGADICCSSPLNLQGWMGWDLAMLAFKDLLCHTAAPGGGQNKGSKAH